MIKKELNQSSNKRVNSSLKKQSKRIGIAKEEMKGFDISLEEFNSISTFESDTLS